MSLVVLSSGLAFLAATANASQCTTVVSAEDPSRRNPEIVCKRVARNSNNGNVGIWRCCLPS
ncbi:MAG: hypothetical protein CBD37_03520 [Cyanobacteria bacterium TMED177]|nr:MAG: hypothetical protein CBD37_03520 [Cyanobacteria bacterium TMED177]